MPTRARRCTLLLDEIMLDEAAIRGFRFLEQLAFPTRNASRIQPLRGDCNGPDSPVISFDTP